MFDKAALKKTIRFSEKCLFLQKLFAQVYIVGLCLLNHNSADLRVS